MKNAMRLFIYENMDGIEDVRQTIKRKDVKTYSTIAKMLKYLADKYEYDVDELWLQPDGFDDRIGYYVWSVCESKYMKGYPCPQHLVTFIDLNRTLC